MLLVAGFVFNLGLLGYFKYADFFINNTNIFFDTNFASLDLVLPLAISFFTFQQIAFLVDCYKAEAKEYDFINYCLFVTFFPQLIAGPIVHHKEMMPQFMLLKNHVAQVRNVCLGLFVFSLGLFKKVIIADTLTKWASAGFDSSLPLGFYEAWMTSLSYTFQLYFDFSGYSDMAIGAALLFNIRLPINFNSPYKALNIKDFWRRWHMTLSRWLRDYVYIPLGGNRCSVSQGNVNIALTFILGGFWHGAGWTFVVWGALHGLAVIGHGFWSKLGYKMNKFCAWSATFLFINFTWVFFRANDLDAALKVLKGMSGLNSFHQINPDVIARFEYGLVFVFLIMVVTLLPNSMQMSRFLNYNGNLEFKRSIRVAIFTGAIMAISVLNMLTSEGTEFLYFNF
jgi:alginate O-acetyltransferase complex protein AlgI